MLQTNEVQRTKKYRRYFQIGENTSVAANTKETLFSETTECIIRDFFFRYDGDDTTGSTSSVIKITVDDIVVLEESLIDLYTNFGYSTKVGGKAKVVCPVYVTASKSFGFYIFLDTYVKDSFLVELTNADTTNAAAIDSSITYDIEI